MKKLLLPLLALIAFTSCLPAQQAASAAVNSATCDAELAFTDTGLQFDPKGVVTDLFITILGEGVETSYDANEVILSVLDEPLSVDITAGSGVTAIASYERETRVKPFVCLAE